MGPALALWLVRDGMAARWLYGAMGTSAESELIQFVVQSRDPRARLEACTILAQFGTKASVPALEKIGLKKEDEEIGALAAEATRLIEARNLDERGMAQLLSELDGQPNRDGPFNRIVPFDRKAAACMRLVATPRVAGKQPEIARKLEALLDDADANTNMHAGHALAVWGDDQSRRIMLDHLASPTYRQWRTLAEDLAKLANTAETAKAIASRFPNDRRTVFHLLETMGPVAEEELIRILETETDDGVRSDACRLLKKCGTPLSLPALRKAEQSKQFLVADQARQTLEAFQLRQISDADFRTVLKTVGTSKDPVAHRKALERLIALDRDPTRAKLVVAAILEAMSDPEHVVQTRAIEVVAEVGHGRGCARLLREAGEENRRSP